MILRSSLVSTLKTCPAKACYAYELGLSPTVGSTKNDLDFGKIVHEALESYHLHGLSSAIEVINSYEFRQTARKNKQTAKILIKHYAQKVNFTPFSLEQNFEFYIGSHKWFGRFDGIAEHNQGIWVVEHKTTNPFYLQLKPNDQFIAYWLGAKELYGEVDGVLINNLDCDKLEVKQYEVRFSLEEKVEWLEEMEVLASTYDFYKEKGIFPRDPGGCFAYNSKCAYYPLCSSPEGSRDLMIEKCYKVNKEQKNLDW